MINDVPLKTLFDKSQYHVERVKSEDGTARWYFRKLEPIRIKAESKPKEPKQEKKKNNFVSLF